MSRMPDTNSHTHTLFEVMTVPYKQLTGPFRRTIVVGDIHGCWDEFWRLMELAEFGEGDALVTVGDFLDPGPGSWDLARFFRQTRTPPTPSA